jgi:hypothetical protein
VPEVSVLLVPLELVELVEGKVLAVVVPVAFAVAAAVVTVGTTALAGTVTLAAPYEGEEPGM